MKLLHTLMHYREIYFVGEYSKIGMLIREKGEVFLVFLISLFWTMTALFSFLSTSI